MRRTVFLPRLVVQAGSAAVSRFVGVIEGIAFWVAVVLPALYVPTLSLYGTERIPVWALAGIVGIHVVALVVGHRHNRPARAATSPSPRSPDTADERAQG